MDLGLAGRAYVLAGASRGLGYATAECLLADSAHVIVASRGTARVSDAVDKLTALAADVGSTGTAHGIAAGNADPDAADRLIAAALQHTNRLDGALISVGGEPLGPAATVTD